MVGNWCASFQCHVRPQVPRADSAHFERSPLAETPRHLGLDACDPRYGGRPTPLGPPSGSRIQAPTQTSAPRPRRAGPVLQTLSPTPPASPWRMPWHRTSARLIRIKAARATIASYAVIASRKRMGRLEVHGHGAAIRAGMSLRFRSARHGIRYGIEPALGRRREDRGLRRCRPNLRPRGPMPFVRALRARTCRWRTRWNGRCLGASNERCLKILVASLTNGEAEPAWGDDPTLSRGPSFGLGRESNRGPGLTQRTVRVPT